MAEWMPKSARPYRPASAKPDVSGVESAARGAYQGAGMGFADEQAGALDALGGHLKRTFTNDWKRTGGGWLEDIKAELGQVTDDYQRGRDESRQAYSEAAEANPVAYGAGQFGGAVATGLLTGGASSLGRAGLKGALTAGALEGAAGGVGNSEADLMQRDVDAYARTFRDALEGGAKGAAFGGIGYGVGKGLKSVGTKALGALRNARGELTEGIAAERQVADDAARVAEEKAQGRLIKDEYAARNQNARMDRQAALAKAKEAREAARAARVQAPRGGSRSPPPSADEFQFTEDQLAGFQRQARQSIGQRVSMSRGYREDLANPDLTSRRKGFAQEYIDNFDVSDPRAAMQAELRQNMAINLGKRGYSAEEIQRIVNRYAPDAASAPKPPPQAAPPAQEPVTPPSPPHEFSEADRLRVEAQIQRRGRRVVRYLLAPDEVENPALLRQRERGFGAQNMGAARYGDETIAYPNADIRRAQAPSGDPFHDARTRVGLIETSAEGGYPGEAQNMMRDFEFRDPKSGRIVKMTTHRTPHSPDAVTVDGIGFKDQVDKGITYEDQWGEGANKVGPRVLKEVLGDLRRSYPGSEVVGGQRVTGINPGRDTSVPMPEVTQGAGARPWEPEPTQVMNVRDAVIQGRGDDLYDLGRTPTLEDLRGIEQPPSYVPRSQRSPPAPQPIPAPQPSVGTPDPFHDAPTRIGLMETTPPRDAELGLRTFEFQHPATKKPYEVVASAHGRDPNGIYLEIIQPKGISTEDAISPEVWAQERGKLGPGIVKQVGAELARKFPGRRLLYAERSTGANPREAMTMQLPEVTQAGAPDFEATRSLDLGDAIRQGRGPEVIAAGGGGSAWGPGGVPKMRPQNDLPPLEDLTQPGRPAFPGDARTAQPFAPRPELRQAYQPRSAVPAAPTQNLRAPQRAPAPAPVYNPDASMNAPRDFDAETYAPPGETMSRGATPSQQGPMAPELMPEPVQPLPMRQARPRPLAPPIAPPSQTVMGAPPGSLVRQARPSVEDLVGQQEAGALGGLVRAGWEGARSANNALAAPFGAAYGIGKEAMENPAVRARAISLFRLDRLARVRPEVWARVGPTLQRAMQAGPERFKAERHVLLLRDPEFRAAEAEADAELERMDGQSPTRRAAGAR